MPPTATVLGVQAAVTVGITFLTTSTAVAVAVVPVEEVAVSTHVAVPTFDALRTKGVVRSPTARLPEDTIEPVQAYVRLTAAVVLVTRLVFWSASTVAGVQAAVIVGTTVLTVMLALAVAVSPTELAAVYTQLLVPTSGRVAVVVDDCGPTPSEPDVPVGPVQT